MAAVALLLTLLVSLPFLFILLRRPVLRRLAVRNAVRRPREALLVVVGSMLGAAIITGSFVVGDAMTASIRAVAGEHLGPADELVLASDQRTWERLAGRLQWLPRVTSADGVLPIQTLAAPVTTNRGGQVIAAPQSQLIGVNFADARRFGGDARATGISGPAPGRSQAAITTDLAAALGIGVGGVIHVHAFGLDTPLVVVNVLPRRGVAGFWLGKEQESRNVLVSPEIFAGIRALATFASLYAAPPMQGVLVSNRGGVEAGVKRTDEVTGQIRVTAQGLGTQVLAVKRLVLEQADATGKSFSQMFTAMGSFGVIAGLLLLVNLFVMLAAERKPELGMARAVGMRRTALVGGFATEGWLYALAATLLGTAAGVGLGRALVALSRQIFNTQHNKFDLFFVLRPKSLAEAFAIAFVIAMLTIVATSVRVARLNIIRAIRDIPEPPARQRRRWLFVGAFAAALGLVWSAGAFASKEPFGLLLGPTLLLVGIAPTVARIVSTRTALSVIATFVVAWSAIVLAAFPSATEGAPVTIYVIQGITLTGGAVVLAALQQERISGLMRRIGAKTLAVRLGLAYPLARRSRTGLTVAMYALVVFILTFITSLSHMVDSVSGRAAAKVRGGYAVAVSSSTSNPIPPASLASVRGVRAIAPLATTTANFTVEGKPESVPWNLTAFGDDFVNNGPPRLEKRGNYPTDLAAWRAVLANPNLIIVDPAFLQNSGGPANFVAKVGSKLDVQDPTTGRWRVVTVAALTPTDYYLNNGALYGLRGARELFGSELVASRFYVALEPGVDPRSFATALQSRFLSNGTDASSINDLMDEAFTMTHQIFQLFEGYLALGLLVGIAGIAVVMIRAVRERRRPIGALRAIGFPSRTIGRSFAIEAGFIAIEGTVIGTSLSLLTLWTLTRANAMGDLTFSVPYAMLALLLVGTVAASLAATIAPAVSATRIRPAVALRTTD
jgi:putative ABC transport system permease protein